MSINEIKDDKTNSYSPPPAFPSKKTGINRNRILNLDKITIIEQLIKCTICKEILDNPYECENCGALFCIECINEWSKDKVTCPLDCGNFKPVRVKLNTKKLLNLLELRCHNYPDCKFNSSYWNIIEHEEKCSFQKIKCPNTPCPFIGHFQMLKEHIQEKCEYVYCECGFCKTLIQRNKYIQHLEKHNIEKSFYIFECAYCTSSENLRRCLCKKLICERCLESQKNVECIKTCYIFQSGCNSTTVTYNLSKHPLPKNAEIKLYFEEVNWVRSGISFSKEIANDQTDINCPQFDIYCILEDLKQLYTMNGGWKTCFNKNQSLRKGDYMTILYKNGELQFLVNDINLGTIINIDAQKKKEPYLLVHCRSNKSKVQILSITEKLD
jgi:hypothetical protein